VLRNGLPQHASAAGRTLLPGGAFVTAMVLAMPGCRPNPSATAGASPAEIRFSDATQQAGVRWRHVNGAAGRLYMPELVGGGGGFVDVDGDGWLDVVLVNSGALPGFKGAPGRHGLFLNTGQGTFRDASSGAGLSGPTYGMGVAAGDYDGDGRVDLYLTGVNDGRLYRNLGRGRFRPESDRATRNSGHWGTSATWCDLNRDGRADLFVANYVKWRLATNLSCEVRGIRTNCGPVSYPPDYCTLLMNRGGGRFEDISQAAGFGRAPAKGLGVVAADADSDGHTDLLVACDLFPNLFFRNSGEGGFREVAVEHGFATNDRGLPRAGMGIDAQEEEPRRWSVWIGNLQEEGTAFFRQGAEGIFSDEAALAGLVPPTLRVLTFGAAGRDFDNDGYCDLALANGHIDMIADRTRKQEVRQQPLLFQRLRDGKFREVTAGAGEPFQARYLGRGLSWGDFDNDGDLDLLMIENNGPAHLWRNDTAPANQWIGFDCRLASGAPAIGARVEVAAGDRRRIQWVRGDGSYLNVNDFRALFGLGAAKGIQSVRVRWPDGREEEHGRLATGRYWALVPRAHPGRLRR